MQTTEATITIRLTNGEALTTSSYDIEAILRGPERTDVSCMVLKTTIHGRRYMIPMSSVVYIVKSEEQKVEDYLKLREHMPNAPDALTGTETEADSIRQDAARETESEGYYPGEDETERGIEAV